MMQGLAGAALLALSGVSAGAEPAGRNPVLAQATIARPVAAGRPANDQREVDQYLSVFRRLRSECGSAAWTLWQSNSYDRWRNRKSSMLSMHFNTGTYPSLPPGPAALPDAQRAKLSEAMTRANDTLREAGTSFKALADYVNAKDFEDDKFKKGDALNARLMDQGRACHALETEMTAQLLEATQGLIEQRRGNAAKPEVVGVMLADWQIARGLSRELARFTETSPARLEPLVKDVTTLVEGRKESFEPLKQNPESALKRFYDRLNDDVAVKMRRLLREAKTPAAFKEKAADRPRSDFWSVRSEIDIGMPEAILTYIRDAK